MLLKPKEVMVVMQKLIEDRKLFGKRAEIKLLFRGQLDPARTKELTDQMLTAGLPI